MTLSLSLATFFRPNSLFAFVSLQQHVYIRHRKYCDEQKAVVVVKHHYQGCQLNMKRAKTRKYVSCFGNLRWNAADNQGWLTIE